MNLTGKQQTVGDYFIVFKFTACCSVLHYCSDLS